MSTCGLMLTSSHPSRNSKDRSESRYRSARCCRQLPDPSCAACVQRDDIHVAMCARKYRRVPACLRRGHFEAFHRGCKALIDRFRHHHARAHPRSECAEPCHIAVTADHRNLARHHHIGSALIPSASDSRSRTNCRTSTWSPIVHVDHGTSSCLPPASYTDGARQSWFLRYAAPGLHNVAPASRRFFVDLLQQILNDLLFVALEGESTHCCRSPAHSRDELAASHRRIVHHQLGPSIRMADRLIRAPPIFFERLALPREHRNPGGSNRRSRMILRRKNVAASPANRRAQIDQRLDQHGV